MEDFLSMVLEFFADLLEAMLHRIKDPRKRKWALTIFYFALTSLVTVALLFLTFSAFEEVSKLGVLVLSVFTVLWVLVSGFLIIRQHRKK